MGFKCLSNGMCSTLAETWKDWTGARFIYLHLNDSFSMRRISLYKLVRPNQMELFRYILLVHCANVNDDNIPDLLEFVQRLRVKLLGAYISGYEQTNWNLIIPFYFSATGPRFAHLQVVPSHSFCPAQPSTRKMFYSDNNAMIFQIIQDSNKCFANYLWKPFNCASCRAFMLLIPALHEKIISLFKPGFWRPYRYSNLSSCRSKVSTRTGTKTTAD